LSPYDTLKSVQNTRESIEAAMTLSEIVYLISLMGSSAEEDNLLTQKAVETIRSYGDQRAMRSVT
jgi:hypothetical protein